MLCAASTPNCGECQDNPQWAEEANNEATMRKLIFMSPRAAASTLTALGAILAFTSAAHADGNPDGHWQFKLLATSVMPSGSVSSVPNDSAGVVTSGLVTQTTASNNVTPTIAIEYFLRPDISLETIAGVSAHHVSATAGALTGAALVDHALVIPATLTLKY